MLEKKCGNCGDVKALSAFYAPIEDGRAGELLSSKFCKTCHESGLIPYGYGWPGFGGMFKTPADTPMVSS